MSEVLPSNPIDQEPPEAVNLFDHWSVTKGRYRPERAEQMKARIDAIDENDGHGVRTIEYAMYALELGGTIRRQRDFHATVSKEDINLDKAEIEKILEDERIAHLVQAKVSDIYEVLTRGYGYIELTHLRELTSSHPSKNTGSLKATERLYGSSLIGALHHWQIEGIIRVMIAEEEGNLAKVPKPKNHIQTVQ